MHRVLDLAGYFDDPAAVSGRLSATSSADGDMMRDGDPLVGLPMESLAGVF